MKWLLRTHRYLSCFVAPAMLFFAVSGGWQAFRLHENSKDGSYSAPAALERLSKVHKAEELPRATRDLFRTGQLVLSVAFVATAVIGLIMAFRIARPVWPVWACLAAGIVIPLLLVLATGPEEKGPANKGSAAAPHAR